MSILTEFLMEEGGQEEFVEDGERETLNPKTQALSL